MKYRQQIQTWRVNLLLLLPQISVRRLRSFTLRQKLSLLLCFKSQIYSNLTNHQQFFPPTSRSAGSSPAAIRESEATGEDGSWGGLPDTLAAWHPHPPNRHQPASPGQEAGEGVLAAPLQTWDLCSLSYTPTQRGWEAERKVGLELSVPVPSFILLCLMLFYVFRLLTSSFKRIELNQRGKGELASKFNNGCRWKRCLMTFFVCVCVCSTFKNRSFTKCFVKWKKKFTQMSQRSKSEETPLESGHHPANKWRL